MMKLDIVENIVGKRRKCWLPAFSPFPTMFSKALFFGNVQSRDCGKAYAINNLIRVLLLL